MVGGEIYYTRGMEATSENADDPHRNEQMSYFRTSIFFLATIPVGEVLL